MDIEHAEGILRDVAARSSYPYTTTGPAAARVLAELDAARACITELEQHEQTVLAFVERAERGGEPLDPAKIRRALDAAPARKD